MLALTEEQTAQLESANQLVVIVQFQRVDFVNLPPLKRRLKIIKAQKFDILYKYLLKQTLQVISLYFIAVIKKNCEPEWNKTQNFLYNVKKKSNSKLK